MRVGPKARSRNSSVGLDRKSDQSGFQLVRSPVDVFPFTGIVNTYCETSDRFEEYPNLGKGRMAMIRIVPSLDIRSAKHRESGVQAAHRRSTSAAWCAGR